MSAKFAFGAQPACISFAPDAALPYDYYPAEKFYGNAKVSAICERTSNMQLNTIAEGMLRD